MCPQVGPQVRVEKTRIGEHTPYEVVTVDPDGTEHVEHPEEPDAGDQRGA